MKNTKWVILGILVGIPIMLVFLSILYVLIPTFGASSELNLTEVITKAQNQEISEIIVEGEYLTIIPRITGGAHFTSRIGHDTDLLSLLVANDVDIGPSGVIVTFKGTGGLGSFLELMLNFLPLIFFGGLILFMIKGLGKVHAALREIVEAIASNPRT